MILLLLFMSYAIILSAALARAGHRSQTAPPAGVSRHDPVRVLIVGGTGGTGRQLVTQALERGYGARTRSITSSGRTSATDRRSGGCARRGFRRSSDARPGGGAFRPWTQAVLLSNTNSVGRDSKHPARHGDSRCPTPGLRNFARHRRQRRSHGSVLHALCHPGDSAFLLLGQDAAGTDDRSE